MTGIESAFNLLETRLQSLVEGSLGRLFPITTIQAELVHGVSQALRGGVLSEDGSMITQEGPIVAPDRYIVFIPADSYELFTKDSDLTANLTAYLYQAANEAGFLFRISPTIRILPAPESDANQIQVVAQHSFQQSGQTAALGLKAEPSEALDAFLILAQGEMFPLIHSVINIGRDERNHLIIKDSCVSRRHAQLRRTKDAFVIADLGSTGGTFVNGDRITQRNLIPGDVISLAGIPLVFGLDSNRPSDRTQELHLPRS